MNSDPPMPPRSPAGEASFFARRRSASPSSAGFTIPSLATTTYCLLVAHILRKAEVQYGDFTGTAAADKADAGYPGLTKMVGLDGDRWWILAVEIYAAEPADLTKDCIRVFAFDRRHGVSSHAELQAYGAEHGTIPVTEFWVNDAPTVELIRSSFKRLAVQLRHRSLGQLDLEVVAEDYLQRPQG